MSSDPEDPVLDPGQPGRNRGGRKARTGRKREGRGVDE